MSKPTTLPRWGDVSAPVTEPNEAKKDAGFAPEEWLPAQYLNWLLLTIYLWIDFLRGEAARLELGALLNWHGGDTGLTEELVSVCAGPCTVDHTGPTLIRRFVAVGNNGAIGTSPDGFTWTSRTSGTTEDLLKVRWNGSLYVAVGLNSVILTSPDGVTWTLRTSPSTTDYYGVGWDAALALWVAVGEDSGTSAPDIATSPDGVTWTARSAPATAIRPGGVASNGAGTFVVTGRLDASKIFRSTDGINWTEITLPTANYAGGALEVGYGNGIFFYAGSYTAGAAGSAMRVWTSPDGITWTSRLTFGGNTDNCVGCVFHGETWTILLLDNNILTSPDGITWTRRAPIIVDGTQVMESIAFGGDRYCMVGFASAFAVSHAIP